MQAPAIEMANMLGQDLLQMALIEDEYMVQALGPYRLSQRSAIALARGDLNGVRTWAIPIFRTRRSKVLS